MLFCTSHRDISIESKQGSFRQMFRVNLAVWNYKTVISIVACSHSTLILGL